MTSERHPEIGHGQVWWCDFPDEKLRPVVVLTRGWIAPLLRSVLVAPITSTVREIPTEVVVGPAEGVRSGSVANLDNVQLVDVGFLIERCGFITAERWPAFCEAMHRVMGCAR
jgi:mRNA interferase MazF